jgi:gliding motility-associated-like protein
MKQLLLYVFLLCPLVTMAQFIMVNGSGDPITGSKIIKKRGKTDEYFVISNINRGIAFLEIRGGEVFNKEITRISTNSLETTLFAHEIGPDDYIIGGGSRVEDDLLSENVYRYRKNNVAWSNYYRHCSDRINDIGLFTCFYPDSDSTLFIGGDSRHAACGRPDLDFHFIRTDVKGNLLNQVAFSQESIGTTDLIYCMEAVNKKLFFGGISIVQPCGGDNNQAPIAGSMDKNFDNISLWTYSSPDFPVNAILLRINASLNNPNNLLSTIWFNRNECNLSPYRTAIMLGDSLGNPRRSFELLGTTPGQEILAIKMASVANGFLMGGQLVENNQVKGMVLINLSHNGDLISSRVYESVDPNGVFDINDFVVEPDKITLLGTLTSSNTQGVIIAGIGPDGNFLNPPACLRVRNLDLRFNPINLQKENIGFERSNDGLIFPYQFRKTTEPIRDLSCTFCQVANINVNAKIDSTCIETCNGKIVLQIPDSSAYTYAWSNNRSNAAISGLCPGDYSLKIINRDGCSKDTSFNISTFDPIRAKAVLGNLSCAPAQIAGTVRIDSVRGGSGPYTFIFDNRPASTQTTFNNLGPGTYPIVIRDAKSCTFDTSVTVPNLPGLSASIPTLAVVNSGDSVTVRVLVNNSSGPITSYSWRLQNNVNQASCLDCPVLRLRANANDSIFVSIVDSLGCTVTLRTALVVRQSFRFNARVDSSCVSICNGRISILGISDTTGYTFAWANGRRGSRLTGLCAGTYQLSVTSPMNERRDTSITIATFRPIAYTKTSTSSCGDTCRGTIIVSPTGSVANVRYQWSNGATQNTLTRLCRGSYSFTITDRNNCPVRDSIMINDLVPRFGLLVEDVKCTNPPSASIRVDSISGTTAPLRFSINNGAFVNNQKFTNVEPGKNYGLRMQDGRGCIANRTISIPSVTPINVSIADIKPLLFGDSVKLGAQVNPPSSIVSYTWRLGQNSNRLSCINCPDPVLRVSQSDTVYLTVRENSGCSANTFLVFKVNSGANVFVPTIFSPNRDNVNDIFRAYSNTPGGQVMLIRIYSRWGELVYEDGNYNLDDPARGWDGTFRNQPANTGVYVYYISLKFADGSTDVLKGDVNLVR